MRRIIALSCLQFLGLISAPALTAEPATTGAPVASDRSQETICRREKETGSLVKSKKTCHSRAQWAYIDDTNQAFGRQLVDDTRSKAGGQ